MDTVAIVQKVDREINRWHMFNLETNRIERIKFSDEYPTIFRESLVRITYASSENPFMKELVDFKLYHGTVKSELEDRVKIDFSRERKTTSIPKSKIKGLVAKEGQQAMVYFLQSTNLYYFTLFKPPQSIGMIDKRDPDLFPEYISARRWPTQIIEDEVCYSTDLCNKVKELTQQFPAFRRVSFARNHWIRAFWTVHIEYLCRKNTIIDELKSFIDIFDQLERLNDDDIRRMNCIGYLAELLNKKEENSLHMHQVHNLDKNKYILEEIEQILARYFISENIMAFNNGLCILESLEKLFKTRINVISLEEMLSSDFKLTSSQSVILVKQDSLNILYTHEQLFLDKYNLFFQRFKDEEETEAVEEENGVSSLYTKKLLEHLGLIYSEITVLEKEFTELEGIQDFVNKIIKDWETKKKKELLRVELDNELVEAEKEFQKQIKSCRDIDWLCSKCHNDTATIRLKCKHILCTADIKSVFKNGDILNEVCPVCKSNLGPEIRQLFDHIEIYPPNAPNGKLRFQDKTKKIRTGKASNHKKQLNELLCEEDLDNVDDLFENVPNTSSVEHRDGQRKKKCYVCNKKHPIMNLRQDADMNYLCSQCQMYGGYNR